MSQLLGMLNEGTEHLVQLADQHVAFEASLDSDSAELRSAVQDSMVQIERAEVMRLELEQSHEQILANANRELDDLEDELDSIRATCTELCDSLSRSADASEQRLHEGLHQFHAQSNELSEAIDEQRQRIADLVKQCEDAVETFRASVLQNSEQLIQSSRSMESACERTMAEIKQTLATILDEAQAAAETLVEHKDDLIRSVTESMADCAEHVTNELISQALGELNSRVQQAVSVVQDVLAVVDGLNDQFDGTIGDVIDKLEGIAELVEQIKPLLELVDELLG